MQQVEKGPSSGRGVDSPGEGKSMGASTISASTFPSEIFIRGRWFSFSCKLPSKLIFIYSLFLSLPSLDCHIN